MPDPLHGIPHNIASNQGTNFTPQKVWEWVRDHRIHWWYHIPHHPEAAILIRHWNCLLRVQLKHQPEATTAQEIGVSSSEYSIYIKAETFL